VNKYSKISVVVPSFNQGEFIERTILSIIGQNYPNLELIVIDGGSSDDTVEVLKKYNKYIAHWVSEEDRGQSDAVNKGLKMTTGSIIGWLNSDDIYLNDNLFTINKYFKSNKKTDIVFANYYFIDNNDFILSRRKEIKFNRNVCIWTKGCYHANCSGFFRESVFEKIGYIDPDLHYSMDFEFYLRAYNKGQKISHYNEIWSGYRLHDASKSIALNTEQLRETNEILQKTNVNLDSILLSKIYYYYYKYFRLIKKLLIGSYLPIKKYKIEIKGVENI
jgi:glycosyltransferase involved in cell wall biosynthesis